MAEGIERIAEYTAEQIQLRQEDSTLNRTTKDGRITKKD